MRLALRALVRDFRFSLLAITTLAFGLGATTAVFSIFDGVLLRPLAYPEPDRLYTVRMFVPKFAHVDPALPINARHFHEWRSTCRGCEQVAMLGGAGYTLTGTGEPERVGGLFVSANFFATLGVRPAMGRDFRAEDEANGADRVAILSHSLWRRRFASDPEILGRKILLGGDPHEVIGVLPEGLPLPRGGQWGNLMAGSQTPEIFRPLGFDPSKRSGMGDFNYAGLIRLKPGVAADAVKTELDAAVEPFAKEFGLEMTARLTPLDRQLTASARAGLGMLLAAVCALMLIVCFNLGGLMLVRTASRSRDTAIRLALGASRWALVGQVMQEAALLVVAGGTIGTLLAYAGVQAFRAAAPIELPRIEEVQVDWRVVAFALAACAFSVAACSILPAWRLLRGQAQDAMKAGAWSMSESSERLRSRAFVVGAEVALSTALLIVGGLLGASFLRVMSVERGFDTEHVLTQNLTLDGPRYREQASRLRFVDEAVRELRRTPGVVAAGATSHLPLHGETWVDLLVTPETAGRELDAPPANFRFATPGYWTAMGIALKQGRLIDESDRGRNVVLLSEAAATKLFPDGSAIGRTVRRGGDQRPWMEVVGVVADARTGLETEPPVLVYEPGWVETRPSVSFVVRTAGDPLAAASSVRQVLSRLDAVLPLPQVRTMERIVSDSVAPRRFYLQLALGFALAALLLTAIGIYGVIAYAALRRTRELGIRLALGEQPGGVARMMLAQGMLPVVAGMVVGLALAAAASRLIASQLFGVEPGDPLTFAAVASLITLAGLGACWLPARRASRLNPVDALRAE